MGKLVHRQITSDFFLIDWEKVRTDGPLRRQSSKRVSNFVRIRSEGKSDSRDQASRNIFVFIHYGGKCPSLVASLDSTTHSTGALRQRTRYRLSNRALSFFSATNPASPETTATDATPNCRREGEKACETTLKPCLHSVYFRFFTRTTRGRMALEKGNKGCRRRGGELPSKGACRCGDSCWYADLNCGYIYTLMAVASSERCTARAIHV